MAVYINATPKISVLTRQPGTEVFRIERLLRGGAPDEDAPDAEETPTDTDEQP